MPAPSPNGEHSLFTRERVLTFLLAGATLIGLYICYLIAKPFIAPIAFALALAVATQRPYDWIRRRFKSDTASAGAAVILVALLVVGPAVALGTYIVQQALDNVNEVQGQGIAGLRTSLEQHPQFGGFVRWAESRLEIESQVKQLGGAIAGYAGAFLKGSVHILTQLIIMLFVLFFMYRDRKAARDTLCQLVPLSAGEANALFSRVASTILATVNGSIIVALVQAVLAGIMYAILGVPAFAVWAALTFITALIPVFGTFLVWGPIAAYLALSGSPVKALVLVGWGMTAIGMIDNVLYPYLVGDRLRLHTVPTLFSILGGISLFGPAGLILGPLALAITLALVDVWWQRTEHGRAAEEAVAENSLTDTAPPGAAMQQRGI